MGGATHIAQYLNKKCSYFQNNHRHTKEHNKYKKLKKILIKSELYEHTRSSTTGHTSLKLYLRVLKLSCTSDTPVGSDTTIYFS